ncbi:MAG: aldehyde dehydrogenase family protein [Bdellovibrionota bacterium]
MLTHYKIINPATEQTLQEIDCDNEPGIQKKFERARMAQEHWSARSLNERIAVLHRFWQLLEVERDSLAETLTAEVGKPLQQSINEINGARSRISFFVENSEKFLSTETVFEAQDRVERIAYEPLGVVAIISAWNYPYLVGVNAIVPALIAGNAVLYKPSEFATLTGLRISELLHRAGIPKDVFAEVLGDGGQGAALTKLALDGFFFTGSVRTGERIRSAISNRFVAAGFELGGKDPVYVCEDVDLDKVVPAVADGVFYNNGQSCCSVERIYVHETLYDRFVASFVDEVRNYKMGDPREPGVYLGPLTRNAQRDILRHQVEDALSKGAKLLLGGRPVAGSGYYFEPTVLANVGHSMLVMKEESFGPIIGIQKVRDDHEALGLINDTEYGLTAGIYTRDEKRALKLLGKVNAGSAYWNCCDRLSPYLPWSGRKNSGLGSTLSHVGIRSFARPKAYHLIQA